MALVEVSDLSLGYASSDGLLQAVRDVSFALDREEVLGIVGESGSGKSTLALAIMGYRPVGGIALSGRVTFDGISLLDSPPDALRRIWGRRIAMVHQNPSATLTPTMTVGAQIAETIRQHRGLGRGEARGAVAACLRAVHLPDPEEIARRYPHELSGGQRQRITIAIALSLEPDVLILDEPTTSLDATTEAVILDLLQEIKGRVRAAMIYISHNLGVIARIATRVAVMYAGEIVETGTTDDIFRAAAHPYTRALLACLSRPGVTKRSGRLSAIAGELPSWDERGRGCIFASRCDARGDICAQAPDWTTLGPTRAVRCWHPRTERGVDAASGAASNARPASDCVLAVEALSKTYPRRGAPSGIGRDLRAVNRVGIEVRGNAIVGLVGESGSGKSTLLRCIAGLETLDGGKMTYLGLELAPGIAARATSVLRALQMVFQDPDSTLNPSLTIGASLRRHLAALDPTPAGDERRRLDDALAQVHLPPAYLKRLPHQLSGGEKQRVAIARAFLSRPELVLCDEPLSSLDVSVQSAICQLLLDLQAGGHAAYVFVSHDLSIVRYMADSIVVMYLGEVVEEGVAESFDHPPLHPYTEALFSAVPVPDPASRSARVRLLGQTSESDKYGAGCIFSSRCPRKKGEACDQAKPPWHELGERRYNCHWRPDELRALQQGTSRAAV